MVYRSPPREGLLPGSPCAVGRVTSTPLPTGRPPSLPGKCWPGRGVVLHRFCIWSPRVRMLGPTRPGTPRPGTDGQTPGGPLGRGCTWVLPLSAGRQCGPRTARAAEGVWSGLLKGLGLVADARQAGTPLAEAACSRLPCNRKHHGLPHKPALTVACAGSRPVVPLCG